MTMRKYVRSSILLVVIVSTGSFVKDAAARPPLFTINPIADQSAPATVNFQYQARYSVDDEDCWMGNIAFGLISGPASMMVTNSGKITWTPSTSQIGEPYAVTINATAFTPFGNPCYGNPAQDFESFTVTVTAAPPPTPTALPNGSIFFKEYTGLGDNVNFNTGISALTHVCGIIGMAALDGDINEDDDGDILQVYMYASGLEWWIRADFRTHHDDENWDIDILCAKREVANVGGEALTKPLLFKNYYNLGDNINYDTRIRTSDYVCGIVGLAAIDGDLNENDTGTIMQTYMFQSGGTWRIRADFRSHHDSESWDIYTFCASTKVAQFGNPSPTKPIFLKAFNGLANNGHYDTRISATDYVCGVVGMTAYDGDIEEHDGGNILEAYMYPAGNTWRIRTDFRTHKDHEGWNINALCVKRGVATANVVLPAPESCVANVPLLFDKIPGKVRPSPHFGSTKKYLGAWNTLIPWPRYTSQAANNFGLGEHFQGIQRLHGSNGQYFVISGGIKNGSPRQSQLIVFKMGSQLASGPWALPSYGHSYKFPSPLDRMVSVIDIDIELWHGGGIQAHQNFLAIPITGDDRESEVRFFDFTGAPENAFEIGAARLIRPDKKSYAAGLTRLSNQRYMALVWDDNDLDFYYSLSTDFRHGFDTSLQRVNKNDVIGGVKEDCGGISPGGCGTYQNVNFIPQCDGAIYVVGTRNTKKASPTVTGTDYADVYRVDWPDNDYSATPIIHHILRKQFYCYNQQCNFGAGAGIYVQDRSHLWLYGASHWLHNGNARYNFNEYSY